MKLLGQWLDLIEAKFQAHYILEVNMFERLGSKSFTYTEYSEEDRQNARLLSMRADFDNSFYVSLRGGTKYDISEACPHCGT